MTKREAWEYIYNPKLVTKTRPETSTVVKRGARVTFVRSTYFNVEYPERVIAEAYGLDLANTSDVSKYATMIVTVTKYLDTLITTNGMRIQEAEAKATEILDQDRPDSATVPLTKEECDAFTERFNKELVTPYLFPTKELYMTIIDDLIHKGGI